MANLIQDLRYGLRQLRRNPAFTIIAVLTLALGIGANTAIFSVASAVLLRPLPYPQSDRLVWISELIPSLKAELASGGDYVDWKDQTQELKSISAYDDSQRFNMTGSGTPTRINAARVSASFFPTLGVEPQLGRAFTPSEDQPNGRNAVILMHAFWQQYLGSDSEVLGKTVTLDATPYTVVGVMPASFHFPGATEVQMLTPLALNEAGERLRVRNTLVRIIGRVKPAETLARVRDELDGIRKRAQPAMGQGGPSGPAGSRATPSPNGRPTMGFSASGPPSPGPGEMVMRGRPEQAQALKGPAAAGPQTRIVAQGQSSARQEGASPAQQIGMTAPGETAHEAAGPSAHARAPANSNSISPESARAGTGPNVMMRTPAGPPAAGGPVGFRGKGPFGPPDVELRVIPLADHLAGDLRAPMLILLGVVGLVLLIACANVANLMLSRAAARAREVAVRAVLGAGRWRLMRQLLSESLVLAAAGGAAGLWLAAWGAQAISALIPSSVGGGILSVARVGVDWRVLVFALAVSIATGILFGLAPAWSATRMDLAERVKEGSLTASAGRQRGALRGALALAELSLALVLLIGAGLLIKSFYRVLSVDPGFAPEHVLTMNLSLTDARYPVAQQKREFFSQVLQRVETLPGVRSAAIGDSLPLSPYHMRLMIRTDTGVGNGPLAGANTTVMMSRLTVSPAYFYTLGIPVLKGRTFTDQDNQQSPQVAVVNESLARHFWPGQDPVGKSLPLFGQPLTIVGVVGDTHHESLSESATSEFYVPYLQQPMNSMQLAVRTAQDAASMAASVRAQINQIDPEQAIYRVGTLEQTLSESVAPRRFNALLLGIFAGIALMLATVGVYGVMAVSVTQRTHEIGIRMALGAGRRDVLRMVIGQGLRLALFGIILGLAGAWALTRFLAGFLYQIRPTDPATFALVSAGLLAVSVLASFIPARRATRVDPMVALRYE